MFLTRKPNIYLVTIEQVPQNAKGKKKQLEILKTEADKQRESYANTYPSFSLSQSRVLLFFPRGFPGKSLV